MAKARQMSDRALAAAIAREEATDEAAVRRALIARGIDPLQPTVSGPIAARTGATGVAGIPYRGATPGGPTHYALPGDVTRRVTDANDTADDAAWDAAPNAGLRRTQSAPSAMRADRAGAEAEAADARAQAYQERLARETEAQRRRRDEAEEKARRAEAQRIKQSRQENAVRGPGRV